LAWITVDGVCVGMCQMLALQLPALGFGPGCMLQRVLLVLELKSSLDAARCVFRPLGGPFEGPWRQTLRRWSAPRLLPSFEAA
jgi:hypothetical protein